MAPFIYIHSLHLYAHSFIHSCEAPIFIMNINIIYLRRALSRAALMLLVRVCVLLLFVLVPVYLPSASLSPTLRISIDLAVLVQ